MSRPFPTQAGPCRDDHALASAFRNIEDRVNLARASLVAAEMLFTDAWACGPQLLSDARKATLGLGSGYQLLVVSDDQFHAVEHLIRRARDDADALLNEYYAAFSLGSRPAA